MLTAGGMRGWRAVLLAGPAAALAAAMVTALPAAAQSFSTSAYGPGDTHCTPPGYCWAPSSLSIHGGDSVTFANGSGYHGVNPTGGPWPSSCPHGGFGTCTFPQAGTYTFNCAVHGDAMKGSITVQGTAPPPPPPPPPTPAPTHSQPPAPQPPAATPPPQAAATSPKPSVPADLALAPSPSPTETPSPSASVSAAPAVNSSPASSAGGSGSPLPLFVAGLAVVALGGGGFYWYRSRKVV